MIIYSEFVNKKLESLYVDVVDEVYIKLIPYKKKYFIKFLDEIKEFIKPTPEVLEIGSYYGVLGDLIKPLTKKYEGLELSIHATNYAKNNYNLEVFNESAENFIKKKNTLDVVIMSHVIEHLDDPFILINNLQSKMNEGSLLIFTTYNMDSLIAKTLGKYYHWIMPMHKFYFTKNFLNNLMKKNNLELIKTKKDTHITSLNYLLKKIKSLFPYVNFIINPLINAKWTNKINIKINLGDLDIYIYKKINKNL